MPSPSLLLTTALTLRVMAFNVEHGGTAVDFAKVVEAIRASGADVVGVEEAEGQIPRLAKALGWHGNPRLQVVSRYPIVDPPGGDGAYVFVQTSPGRVVAMANVHLPSDPYGPDLAQSGSAEDVLALERRLRMPAIEAELAGLDRLVASGVPVFLTGDFNAPSHHDWVAAMVGRRPQLRYPLPWPETAAVEAAGFRDSYREAHPDPRSAPGLTWWAPRPRLPGWNPEPLDPQDRIDFVFAAGPAQARSSRIVGEQGGPGVDVGIAPPWPSDHRGVVSSFLVTPSPAPILVSAEPRLVSAGDPLEVVFHAHGRSGERVAIVAATPEALAIVEQATGPGSPASGTLAFATASLPAGAYQAELRDASGKTLAAFPFWVQERGARPEVALARESFRAGEPIALSWKRAPGDRWDWVAIYKDGVDPASEAYLLWRHTQTAIAGAALMDGSAEGDGWPLAPGRYVAYLLSDDGDVVLAKAPFSVRAPE